MHAVLAHLLRLPAIAALAAVALLALRAEGSAPFAPHWSAAERAVLASLSLSQLEPAPLDPSNAVEQQPAAVALGRRLFEDTRLSRNGAVSCASCHDAARQFQDGLPLSRGLATGTRRAMPLLGAGHSPWLFWDGRKDSLWAQALGPLEDAAEHGLTRTRVVRAVATHHRAEFEALFGPLPALEGLPEDAGPLGSAAERANWAALDGARRAQVSRAFAQVGKAIAAFEKSLQHRPTRLDRYLDAVQRNDPTAQNLLQSEELRGLRLFIGKAQCVSCHNGPLLSDRQFHNTGVPPRDAARPDRGRAAAIHAVRSDEFNCLGPFSDARAEQCQELRFIADDDPGLLGAFKTPGLRGVAGRPPYMHAGQMATLEQVLRHYVEAPVAALGHSELSRKSTRKFTRRSSAHHAEREPIRLSEAELADVLRFLHALDPLP